MRDEWGKWASTHNTINFRAYSRTIYYSPHTPKSIKCKHDNLISCHFWKLQRQQVTNMIGTFIYFNIYIIITEWIIFLIYISSTIFHYYLLKIYVFFFTRDEIIKRLLQNSNFVSCFSLKVSIIIIMNNNNIIIIIIINKIKDMW